MVGRGRAILCACALLAGAGGSVAAADEGTVVRVGAVRDAPVFRQVERVPRGALLAHEVDRLIDRVVALNENHGWRWSEAGALIACLEEAFIDLDRSQFGKAGRQLGDFSDRIAAYINDGSLPKEAGVPLLDAAGAILGRVDALQRAQRLAGPADAEEASDPAENAFSDLP
jgi:hypothetical protein